MAGVLRKTMVYLGLVEQADDEYDDLMEDELEPTGQVRRLGADEPVPVRRYESGRDSARNDSARTESRGALAVETRARAVEETRVEQTPSYRITTFVPSKYNDAKEIGEHFRQDVPVIMNLTEMDDDSAKRLVDFAAGLTFGLRGSLEKVTNKVFLLSPSNVTVSAEDKARIREGGFFNQS